MELSFSLKSLGRYVLFSSPPCTKFRLNLNTHITEILI